MHFLILEENYDDPEKHDFAIWKTNRGGLVFRCWLRFPDRYIFLTDPDDAVDSEERVLTAGDRMPSHGWSIEPVNELARREMEHLYAHV